MKDIKTKDLAAELLEKFNEQYPNGDSYELVKFVIDYYENNRRTNEKSIYFQN